MEQDRTQSISQGLLAVLKAIPSVPGQNPTGELDWMQLALSFHDDRLHPIPRQSGLFEVSAKGRSKATTTR